MSERIGIVVNFWDGKIIKGYLGDTEVTISTNENSFIKVKQTIFKTYFTYDLKTGILRIDSFAGWGESKNVAYCLRAIGFKNVKLEYEDKLYQVDDQYKVSKMEDE